MQNEKEPKMHHYFWNRADFDRLQQYSLLPTDNYPKFSDKAMMELRRRGLLCEPDDLAKAVEELELIPQPAGGSSRLEFMQWTKDQIDSVAEWLARRSSYTDEGVFCEMCNLRFGQVVQAYRVAMARFGWAYVSTFELTYGTVTIRPAENPGEYATLIFSAR